MTIEISIQRRAWRHFLLFLFVLSVGILSEKSPQAAQRHPDKGRYGKRAFFSNVTGTVAFLPGIKGIEDAREFVSFRLLPESGSYILPKQDRYWFVVNHRVPRRAGEPTYLGIAAISFLDQAIRRVDMPVSMFRNDGWFRPKYPAFKNENEKIIYHPLCGW